MAKAQKETHEKLASFGGLILVIALISGAIWLGHLVWSKNQPAKPEPTRQQVAQQQIAKNQPRHEVFTLYPGQGKVLVTNFGKVIWKTTGAALVRERDQAWHGQWKEDLPGRGTPFDNRAAHAIEFWVPKDFPRPVTIKIEIRPARA